MSFIVYAFSFSCRSRCREGVDFLIQRIMITIVIKDNTVSKESILAYIEREHIEGEYEVVTREEYRKRKADDPVFNFKLPPPCGMTDLTGTMLAEERRQRSYRKQQQKYASRFYRKR